MRTDVDTVDEPVEFEETEVEPERRASYPPLRVEETPPALTDDKLREVRKRHIAFKQIGRSRDDGLATVERLTPLSLYPYLDVDRLRGDYPVCIFEDQGAGIAPLSRVIDRALDELELDGDDLERCRRWALQLEAQIRRESEDAGDTRLFKLWNRCSEKLSNQVDPDKREKLHDSLSAVRNKIPSDARLVACHPQAAPSLLEALLRGVQAELKETKVSEVLQVVQHLNDLLSLEYEESDTGLAPEHLKESVGEAFQSDLDFDALSDLLHDAPHGESLSVDRRSRIESIVRILDRHVERSREKGLTIDRISASSDLIDSIRSQLETESSIAKAWLAARLETGNRFDEKRHGALLMNDSPAKWGAALMGPAPLPPMHLDLREGFTIEDIEILAELFDRQVPVRILVTVGDCVAGNGAGDSEPYLSLSLGERLLVSSGSSGFLCQRSLSSVEDLVEAMRSFLRYEETAVLVVFDGSKIGSAEMHPYLKSAAATESRVVPTFLSMPGTSSGWADRFSVAGNEQPEKIWPETIVDVSGEKAPASRRSTFSAAALMLCDARFSEHFGMLDRSEWHEDLVPIEEYSAGPNQIPYLEAATEDGAVRRVIATDYVWRQIVRVSERWTNLRELGGIANSFARKAVSSEKERLELEFRERVEALEAEHRATLESTTGQLAQEIVANIAAGLLGEATVGPPPPRPKAAPPVALPAEPAEEIEEQAPAESPPEEEEDLAILDEAYVETLRCTTCDECTTINPRMFAYNENKQAYIVDVSEGTYRELVLAAEKCPVRIIHPGKPVNPDEPHLDELLKRAEPFR